MQVLLFSDKFTIDSEKNLLWNIIQSQIKNYVSSRFFKTHCRMIFHENPVLKGVVILLLHPCLVLCRKYNHFIFSVTAFRKIWKG